jgi:putative transposase
MKLNKEKVKFIVDKLGNGWTAYDLSRQYEISISRIYQIKREAIISGRIPEIGKKIGRPRKPINEYETNSIRACYEEFKLSASILRPIIKAKYGININHNRIHRILSESGFVKQMEKKIRKRPWVRYERDHSLTAVHMDWLEDKEKGLWICAVIDDASRMILAFGEFSNATAENTVLLLKQAMEYGKIKELITDQGPQFTSDLLKEFCELNNIQQIFGRINHPQTNGKIERWFGLYRQKRHLFPSLKEFVYWYNHVKPHLSLNFEELETPAQAFRRKYKYEKS